MFDPAITAILKAAAKGDFAPESPKKVVRDALHGAAARRVDSGDSGEFPGYGTQDPGELPTALLSWRGLKRDMAILATSGREWANRTRRLAARVPISTSSPKGSSSACGGWRITEKGCRVLDLMEARPVNGATAEFPASEDQPPRLVTATGAFRSRRLQQRRRESASEGILIGTIVIGKKWKHS
jgi:hypothetical protein